MIGWNGNRLDGCHFEAPRPKDYRVAFADQGSALRDDRIPKRVDLRPDCTAVEDQGRMSSCTANAAVGALEYHYRKRDGVAPELSRMYVYYNTRRLKGTIGTDSGARISEAMAAVLAFGACRDEFWPYAPELFAQEPPAQCYTDGLGHEALQYARLPGVEGTVRALAVGLPVVFGTFLPQRCYEEAARTGRIPATRPEERTAQPAGGHAMLMVGYDLDQQALLIRNSWGAQWGEQGYCWLPFEEAAYFSPIDSFWTLMSVEPPQGLRVVKPAMEPAAMASAAPAAPAASEAGSLADKLRREIRADLDSVRRDARSRFSELRASLRGDQPAPSPEPEPSAVRQGQATLKGACYQCQGTGVCYYCKGSTRNMGYPCNACSFSGRCGVCGGSGQS